MFRVLSPHPHLQPHPHPHPPAYLPSPPYSIVRPRPLPSLSALWGLGPLTQKPPASQLSSSQPPAGLPGILRGDHWPVLLPLVGQTHPSPTRPDTWSTRATQLGNSRTAQAWLTWWLQAPLGIPQALLLPFLGNSQLMDSPATRQPPWPPLPCRVSWKPGREPRWLALPRARDLAWAAGRAERRGAEPGQVRYQPVYRGLTGSC